MTSALEDMYASLKDSADYELISDLIKDVSKQSAKLTMDEISVMVKPKNAEKKRIKGQLDVLQKLLQFLKNAE